MIGAGILQAIDVLGNTIAQLQAELESLRARLEASELRCQELTDSLRQMATHAAEKT